MTQREISHPEPLPAYRDGHAGRHIADGRRLQAGGGHVIECHVVAPRSTPRSTRHWPNGSGCIASACLARQRRQTATWCSWAYACAEAPANER